jgi:signal peptidase I
VGGQEGHTSPRSPWAAALFSFLAPGLGQLYDGLHRRALIAAVLALAAEFLAIPLAMTFRGGIQLFLLALVVVFIAIIIPWDAYRQARQSTSPFVLRKYNRWYVYTSLFLIFALIIRPEIRRFTLANVLRTYRLPSTAMQPGLLMGDYILSRVRRGTVHRGELVVYNSADEIYLKRIIGMPGDTISMKLGALSVNGRAIKEDYAFENDSSRVSAKEFSWQRKYLLSGIDSVSYQSTLNTWGPIVVPSRRYFVLGDNRSHSEDSRYDGFVEDRAILTEPTTVYFSRDPDSKNVRWRRIGLSIR